VRAINEKLPELQTRDVELALNCMLEQLANAIVQGGTARSPKTGEVVNLPAKVAVHFKPGKEMRGRVYAARDQRDITGWGLN
jgi:integration host factor subunit beta